MVNPKVATIKILLLWTLFNEEKKDIRIHSRRDKSCRRKGWESQHIASSTKNIVDVDIIREPLLIDLNNSNGTIIGKGKEG